MILSKDFTLFRGVFFLCVPSLAAAALFVPKLQFGNEKEGNGAKPTKLFYGYATCIECHNRPEPYVNPGNPAICRCTEMNIWLKEDKHKIAAKVLADPRGKKIGQLLKIKDVTKDKQCVSCHGVLIEGQDAKLVDDSLKDELRLEQGVSCVVCHGSYENWIDVHGSAVAAKRKAWRKLDRATKEEKWGMTDLWNPVKRAKLCASCHIGNVAEGKIVTHEMYAAGHPPLPGFELATFSNQMPRHWQYLKEKDEKVLELLDYDAANARLEETNLLAIGSLVNFQASMDILAHLQEKEWPELAQYDCYACHHELASKSWRQKRGYVGKPGRPPMHYWPAVLVDLGLTHAAADDKKQQVKILDEFQGKLKLLQSAFDEQPFGNKTKVQTAAKQAAEWVGEQVLAIQQNIAGKKYAKDAPAQLLARLHKTWKQPLPDFASARQLAWAFEILHDEGHWKSPTPQLKSSAVWQKLDAFLGLKLPEGQTSIEPSLAKSLARISAYDPDEFEKSFEALFEKHALPGK